MTTKHIIDLSPWYMLLAHDSPWDQRMDYF